MPRTSSTPSSFAAFSHAPNPQPTSTMLSGLWYWKNVRSTARADLKLPAICCPKNALSYTPSLMIRHAQPTFPGPSVSKLGEPSAEVQSVKTQTLPLLYRLPPRLAVVKKSQPYRPEQDSACRLSCGVRRRRRMPSGDYLLRSEEHTS